MPSPITFSLQRASRPIGASIYPPIAEWFQAFVGRPAIVWPTAKGPRL